MSGGPSLALVLFPPIASSASMIRCSLSARAAEKYWGGHFVKIVMAIVIKAVLDVCK